jgi:hypothetical protein
VTGIHVTFVPNGEDEHGIAVESVDHREHDLSADCWCRPLLDYTDPDTGVSVYVHKRSTDE